MSLIKQATIAVIGSLVIPVVGSSYTLKGVEILSGKDAAILFKSSNKVDAVPVYELKDHGIELTFPKAVLSEELKDKSEFEAPHSLIHRMVVYTVDGTVKAKIILNGSTDDLKSRVQLSSGSDGVKVSVSYPDGSNKAASFFSDEDLPVSATSTTKPVSKESTTFQLIMVIMVLGLSGIGTYFLVRTVRKGQKFRGSRKYLVEQLSYCPIGQKAAVSLIKVGNEFVLVGVTHNQVTMLSSLPKLQTQYEGDAQFEREHFKVAVEEQLSLIQPKPKSRQAI